MPTTPSLPPWDTTSVLLIKWLRLLLRLVLALLDAAAKLAVA
jgi:hypothetical protein